MTSHGPHPKTDAEQFSRFMAFVSVQSLATCAVISGSSAMPATGQSATSRSRLGSGRLPPTSKPRVSTLQPRARCHMRPIEARARISCSWTVHRKASPGKSSNSRCEFRDGAEDKSEDRPHPLSEHGKTTRKSMPDQLPRQENALRPRNGFATQPFLGGRGADRTPGSRWCCALVGLGRAPRFHYVSPRTSECRPQGKKPWGATTAYPKDRRAPAA